MTKIALVLSLAKSVIYSSVLTCGLTGCGLFYSLNQEPEWSRTDRRLNKDPFHIHSCGPIALDQALSRLGVEISRLEISHDIQKNGSFLRGAMAIFTKEARSITFPAEIKSQLKKNGFKLKRVANLSDLTLNNTAIVLIHKKGSVSGYHWACFPVEKNIVRFFGENTVVDLIFLIQK